MAQKKLIIFMPSIEGGGVEKNLFKISNFLSKNIKNISIITASIKYKRKFSKKIELLHPVSHFWDTLGRKYKYFICLIILFKKIIEEKKLVVFSFQANVYCIILCKLFGVKVIVRSNSSPSGWSKNFLKNLIFKKVLKAADLTIVNSFEFKKELKNKFNVNAKNIYNPLNLDEIKKLSKEKINISFFKDKNILKLINVARFTDQKDHFTLLKSINILKNKIPLKLLIIGRGKNKKEMEIYIKKNNLEKIIKIINFQKNPIKFIKKSDVFVLSSTFEGLPNVLLEAMTIKKYIISSDCPTGPKEILQKGKYGSLFKVSNQNDLAKKITEYYNNKKSFLKKVELGYKSLGRFDQKINLNKYLNEIENFLVS